jgi:predicted enzyme related to lactoylglutathione lyase
MATFGVGEGMMNQVASITPAPAGVPSHWVSSIAVRSLDRAKGVVHAHAGKVLVDKIEVPKIGAYSVINDPQGATVCVFEGTSTTPMPQ